MDEQWQAGDSVTLAQTMFKSALVRRVSIYLVLSSAAVGVVNAFEIGDQKSYQIYIPLFIAIYILSRWIDSCFGNPSIDKKVIPTSDQPKIGKGFGSTELDSLKQSDQVKGN